MIEKMVRLGCKEGQIKPYRILFLSECPPWSAVVVHASCRSEVLVDLHEIGRGKGHGNLAALFHDLGSLLCGLLRGV